MSVGCGAEGSHGGPGLGEAGGPGRRRGTQRCLQSAAVAPHNPGSRAEAVAAALPNMAARVDVTGGCGSAGAGRGRGAGSGASEGRG